MNKYEVFKLAHKNRLTYTRRWMMRTYSVPLVTENKALDYFISLKIGERETATKSVFDEGDMAFMMSPRGQGPNVEDFRPGYVYYSSDKKVMVLNEGLEFEEITGTNFTEPLYGILEQTTVAKDDFLMVKETTKTNYSTLLHNLVIYEYAFGDALPFVNAKMSPKGNDAAVAKAWAEKKIDTAMYRNHTKGLGLMECMSIVSVPSATPKAALTHPGVGALKKKLLEKHKDELGDPVTVAHIEAELVKLDGEHLKGDPSDRFFNGKARAVSRKRMLLIFGGEPTLEDATVIKLSNASLTEGINIDDLPMMVNSLRMGSFYRGAETANGGEAAKFAGRIYQNTRLADKDCGTKVGNLTGITSKNYSMFVGRHTVGGKQPHTLSSAKALVGKGFYLRTPQACATVNGNYCEVCMGDDVTNSGVGLAPQASAVGNSFMIISLSQFHGRKLETAFWNYAESIR